MRLSRAFLAATAVAAVAATPLWAAGSRTAVRSEVVQFPTSGVVTLEFTGTGREVIDMPEGSTKVEWSGENAEILAAILRGKSPIYGDVEIQFGREVGTAPVLGRLENMTLDRKGGFVGADSFFDVPEFVFRSTNASGTAQALITVVPAKRPRARIYTLPPNLPVKPQALGPLDHFKCYTIGVRAGFRAAEVRLADQFESSGRKLLKPVTLCAPVSKNGGGVRRPLGHLKCYSIESRSDLPKDAELQVSVQNQFGGAELIVLQPRTLCAPTLKRHLAKATSKPVPPVGSLASLSDHFTCYEVRSQAPFTQRVVSLQDQFEIERARVLRPVSLCAPVEKNGVRIADSVTHLTCYAIQDLTRKVKPVGRLVVVRNQFGVETLTVARPETLCVPSTKTPPCSQYAVRTEAELQIRGTHVGRLIQVLHTPYRGVPGSPCK